MPEGDKTHEPTPRRREQAREEGQVARSQDLASAVVVMIGIILLMTLGRQLAEQMGNYTVYCLGHNVFLGNFQDADELFQNAGAHWYEMTLRFLKPLSVIFLLLVLIAILANLFQTGFLWLPNKLGLDFTRLDPIKGFGRIFSMQALVRLGMGVVKLAIASLVAYYAVIGSVNQIIGTTETDERQIIAYIFSFVLWVALKVAVALVIIAIIDFMYQWWKHEQDLKMTMQELRDEMKNMMGDPQILSKRRQLQREMAAQRNGQGVPQADVVVTNPTHFAVALKYDPETMKAPVVVAKGADFLARQIRKIAEEHGIPILERKPLARALFRTVEVGQPIPAEHYAAVAEILAYVYNLKGKKVPQAA
ncbi:MAG TPA: flagellar biosynthesis protein FlhB [Planctomycetaceae bacterium]|nr:flagellar biosynthesis protein FlhB [Planctomycetaceae bacterium]